MWKVVSASAIGTSHFKDGSLCQDFCIANLENSFDHQNYVVCLVADGAGSAKHSKQGAEMACNYAALAIRNTLNSKGYMLNVITVEQWIKQVQNAIHQDATVNKLAIRDYACTLLGAIIGEHQALFFQIGDGAIVASNGYTQGIVFCPDNGPCINMTYFVTDKNVLAHLHVITTHTKINEVALFTDGIQRLALSIAQQTPYFPFFEPMFKLMRSKSLYECKTLNTQLKLFLDSRNINDRTDDDKSLILATRMMQ